jgi:hypothetical protein
MTKVIVGKSLKDADVPCRPNVSDGSAIPVRGARMKAQDKDVTA